LRQSVLKGILGLDRAHIGGVLSLRGTQLHNDGRRVLSGEALTVDGDMECDDGFVAHGRIHLTGAHVGGRLTFNGAVLEAELHMGRLRASELSIRPSQAMTQALYLPQASVETLEDDPATWPPEIRLNGFVYNAIRDLEFNHL
jgi:hypothetical protein